MPRWFLSAIPVAGFVVTIGATFCKAHRLSSALRSRRSRAHGGKRSVCDNVTLDPGAYTAIVRGAGEGTGVGVIGAYKVN